MVAKLIDDRKIKMGGKNIKKNPYELKSTLTYLLARSTSPKIKYLRPEFSNT